MEKLDSLFTLQSLLSLQGSAAAALLVPNVLAVLFGDSFKPAKIWVAFGLAIVLSYLVAFLAPDTAWTKWLLAFFNGFLIFASAVGINQGASSYVGKGLRKGKERHFFQSWF